MKRLLHYISLIILPALLVACGENYLYEELTPGEATDDSKTCDIDSTSHWYKCEYTYGDNVVELTPAQLDALEVDATYGTVLPAESVLRFKAGTDEAILPSEGQIIVSGSDNAKTRFGYAGRVQGIVNDGTGITVRMGSVELTEVFARLDLDIKLNKEELSNTVAGVQYYDNVLASQVSMNDFYADAPSCEANARMESDSSRPDGRSGSISYGDGNFEWQWQSEDKSKTVYVNTRIGSGFRLDMGGECRVKDKSGRSLKVGLEGSVNVVPLTVTKKIRIENHQYVDGVEIVALKCEPGIELDVEGQIDFASIQFPQMRAVIPIGSVFGVGVAYQLELGATGSISAGCGMKKSFFIQVAGNPYNEDEELPVPSISSSDDLGITFDRKFKVAGSIYFKPKEMVMPILNFATNRAAPVVLEAALKYSLNVKADFADENLYKKNPTAALDVDVSAQFGLLTRDSYGSYQPFLFLGQLINNELYRWPEYRFSIKGSKSILHSDFFPLFPQIEDCMVERLKDSPKAAMYYNSSAMYLFRALVRQPKFSIVNQHYFDFPEAAGNFRSVVTPEAVGHNLLTTRYLLDINGLTGDLRYYAIPEVEMKLGGVTIATYQGNPIEITESVPRLACIGPVIYSGGVVSNSSVAFRYDPDGRITKVDNRLTDSETFYSFGESNTIKSYEYTEDSSDQPRRLSDLSVLSNVILDENTGVIKSCQWDTYDYNNPHLGWDKGNARFYYDNELHLTSIAFHDSDGGSTLRLDWDNQGRLNQVLSSENDGSYVRFDYKYPLAGKNENKCGQWTPACCMWDNIICMAHLGGKASSELPSQILVEDHDAEKRTTENYSYKFSYRFNADGSIKEERINIIEEDDRLDITLPYGYRNISVSNETNDNDTAIGMSRSSADPRPTFKIPGRFYRRR